MLIKKLSVKIATLILVAFLGLNTVGCALAFVDFTEPLDEATTETTKEQSEANTDTETEEVDEPTEVVYGEEIILDNGHYIAGEDFVPGIYTITAIEGHGNVYSDNFSINAIMGVSDDGFYEKEYKNIELPEGTKLTVDGVTIKLIPKIVVR